MGSDVRDYASPEAGLALVYPNATVNNNRINFVATYQVTETLNVRVAANEDYLFRGDITQLLKPEFLSEGPIFHDVN